MTNGEVRLIGGFASTGIVANATNTVGDVPAGFPLPKVNVIVGAGTSTGSVSASLFVTTAGQIQLRTDANVSSYYMLSAATWRAAL